MSKKEELEKNEENKHDEELDFNDIANEVIKEIESDAPDTFKNLPDTEKGNFVKNIIHKVFKIEKVEKRSFFFGRIFTGPLPPPEILSQYNKVHPDFADRLLTDFERQGEHRRLLEQEVIKSQLKESNRGQIFAFLLAVIVILVGGFVIYLGPLWVGITLIVSDICGFVFIYFKGKSTQKKDLEEKA